LRDFSKYVEEDEIFVTQLFSDRCSGELSIRSADTGRVNGEIFPDDEDIISTTVGSGLMSLRPRRRLLPFIRNVIVHTSPPRGAEARRTSVPGASGIWRSS